jgi:hypothetical protein
MNEIEPVITKRELLKLLASNEEALKLFRFLDTRKRSTPISDLPQLLSYLRKANPEGVDQIKLSEVLTVLTKLGFCIVRGSDGREKIHWDYWIFPVFIGDQLVGLEIKSLEALQNNRNAFRNVRMQVESIKKDYLRPKDQRQRFLDIDFEAEIDRAETVTDLSAHSLEDLLAEIKRRGLDLQLQVKN